jgi:hypothetical protein
VQLIRESIGNTMISYTIVGKEKTLDGLQKLILRNLQLIQASKILRSSLDALTLVTMMMMGHEVQCHYYYNRHYRFLASVLTCIKLGQNLC